MPTYLLFFSEPLEVFQNITYMFCTAFYTTTFHEKITKTNVFSCNLPLFCHQEVFPCLLLFRLQTQSDPKEQQPRKRMANLNISDLQTTRILSSDIVSRIFIVKRIYL